MERLVGHFIGDDRAVDPAVFGDLTDRGIERVEDDVDANLLVSLGLRADLLHRLTAAEEGDATTGDNPLLDCGAGRMEGILDAGLLLLHLRLGPGTDGDDRHAAGELGEPLLELLTVVLAVGGIDLVADLLDARGDVGRLAGALDDRRLVLVDGDRLRLAEVGEIEALQRQPEVLADERATGEHGDVAEHRLAAVAEARRLGGADVEHAAELVDDQRGEGIAINILGNDQERLARLGDLLEEREELPQIRDLLLVDQDQRVGELAIHFRGAVDEVGGDVPLVDLHAVDKADGGLGRLPLLNGDHAILAHLLKGLGDEVADGTVVVGGDGTDLGNLFRALNLLRHLVEPDGGGGDGLFDAAADGHRI